MELENLARVLKNGRLWDFLGVHGGSHAGAEILPESDALDIFGYSRGAGAGRLFSCWRSAPLPNRRQNSKTVAAEILVSFGVATSTSVSTVVSGYFFGDIKSGEGVATLVNT